MHILCTNFVIKGSDNLVHTYKMPTGPPLAPPGLLESLPDADLNYSGCALQQIKNNDPHVSFLVILHTANTVKEDTQQL